MANFKCILLVVVIGFIAFFTPHVLVYGNKEVSKEVELASRVIALEERVLALENEMGTVKQRIVFYEKITETRREVGGRQYIYPYTNQMYQNRPYRSNTEYTFRSHRQIHHPEQVERDNYERKHGN